MSFGDFLFHLSEVAVVVDFAREKKMLITGFTHRKSALWKTCELHLTSYSQFQFWYEVFYENDKSMIIAKNKSYCSGCVLEFLPVGMTVVPCLGIAIVPVLATLLIP